MKQIYFGEFSICSGFQEISLILPNPKVYERVLRIFPRHFGQKSLVHQTHTILKVLFILFSYTYHSKHSLSFKLFLTFCSVSELCS